MNNYLLKLNEVKKVDIGITAAVWHLRLIPNCSSPFETVLALTLNSLITGMM